jgi:catechol 2,3-dioxygenase-like lactoylglutathione lyase family enzyme
VTVKRLEHIGIVVEDLPAAVAFFVDLGLDLEGETTVEGEWVDRIVGLEGVHSEIAVLQAPGGGSRLELAKFHSPVAAKTELNAPSNALGLRHILFVVDNLNAVVARMRERGNELVGTVEKYEDSYLLCYLRGPEGIIVELAQELS